MKLKSEKKKENSSQNTESKAAITDRILPSITLSYLTGLLKTGLKEPLNSSHLLEFEPHLKTEALSQQLESYWSELREYHKNPTTQKKPSLGWHLFLIVWKKNAMIVAFFLLEQLTVITYPVVLNLFLLSISNQDSLQSKCFLGIALVLSPILNCIIAVVSNFVISLSMTIMNAVLSDAIVEKLARIILSIHAMEDQAKYTRSGCHSLTDNAWPPTI